MSVEFVKVAKSISSDDFNQIGVDLALLIVDSGLAQTKSEARRFIQQGAIKLADQRVSDPFARLAIKDGTFLIVEKNP